MYTYRAFITRVIDGDSFECEVDPGFRLRLLLKGRQACRVLGINAPEVTGATKEAGLAAAARARELIEGKHLIIRTYRDDQTDKYGRYLADVFLEDGRMLGEALVAEGHAVFATY